MRQKSTAVIIFYLKTVTFCFKKTVQKLTEKVERQRDKRLLNKKSSKKYVVMKQEEKSSQKVL